MLAFVRRHWFLLLLATFLWTGMRLSTRLAPIAERLPTDAVVFGVLLLMALTLDAASMLRAVRRPWAVLLAVSINFAILPLAAWPVARGLALLSADFGNGLLIAAAVPTTLASAAVWTRRAGGNETVPLLATMIANMACFAVTPFWLELTAGRTADVEATPQQMAIKLAWTCVLPVALGQLARRLRPLAAWADRHRRALGSSAQCGILVFVLVGAVSAGGKLAGASGAGTAAVAWAAMIASVVGVHLAMLALGHALGLLVGLPREERIGVGFSGSQKTLMTGLLIAQNYFGGLSMLPIIAYHVCQLLVDTVAADRLRRGPRPATNPPAAEDAG